MMQSTSRRTTSGVSGRRVHNALIGAQVALTLLMMAGAGAAIGGFLRVMHTPLGYDPHNVMSVGIPIHDGTYKTWPERAAYFEQLHAAVAGVPAVTDTAISSNATPPSNGFNTKFEIVGKPSGEDQTCTFQSGQPRVFPAAAHPAPQGRIWDETENHRGALLIVMNQTFAHRNISPTATLSVTPSNCPRSKPQPPYLLTAPGRRERAC